MARPKVRASALPFASRLTEAGIRLDQLEPDSSGWHDEKSITAALAKRLSGPPATPPRAEPAMSVQAALDSGRFSPDRRQFWENRFAEDPVGTGETLASLHPVFAEEREAERRGIAAAAATYRRESVSDTPLLDELDEAVYGPSVEARRRREDLQAEAELRATIDAEEQRAVEASAFTDDELNRLFGE